MVQCPQCESEATVKNGPIHNGKQGYLCKDCRRQFVPAATKKVIAADAKAKIDKLLLEKIPLAGMARSMDVSESWLQAYVNKKHADVTQFVAGRG